jgi:hypothetical protein
LLASGEAESPADESPTIQDEPEPSQSE